MLCHIAHMENGFFALTSLVVFANMQFVQQTDENCFVQSFGTVKRELFKSANHVDH